MAKGRGDFTDILVRKKVLSPEQLDEAINLGESTGIKLQDALAKLNYSSPTETVAAMAEFYNVPFVDLTTLEIPKTVIELVPESVAREHIVIPLALEGNTLKLITSDPTNYEALQ